MLLDEALIDSDELTLTVVRDANKNGVVDMNEAPFINGGELEAGEQLAVSAQVSTPNLFHSDKLTASGANFFDDTETVSANATAVCTPPDVTPNVTLVKECDSSFGGGTGVQLVVNSSGELVVEVHNLNTVSNAGNEDLDIAAISDTEGGTLEFVSGDAGITCGTGAGNTCTGTLEGGADAVPVMLKYVYRPDGQNIIGALANPSGLSFKNIADVKAFGAITGGQVTDDDDAICELCACPDCPPEP
jgi:hypothetical protein